MNLLTTPPNSRREKRNSGQNNTERTYHHIRSQRQRIGILNEKTCSTDFQEQVNVEQIQGTGG
jgi:hypothetical protein